MNIDALDLAEQQLLVQVRRVAGLMDEKHEQLQQSGVFREYGEIYEAYVELIESESVGLEALKRAVFLMWYEQAEPACFSGVFELSAKASRKVLKFLENKIEAGELDIELKWMLPYYNMIADWVFSQHADFPNLVAYLSRSDSELWHEVDMRAEFFAHRGQMGAYWLSIILAKEARSGIGAS